MTTHATKQSSSRFRFVGETIAELKKVVWLRRREAVYLTGLVIAISVTAGIILGVLDYSFSRLIDGFFLAG